MKLIKINVKTQNKIDLFKRIYKVYAVLSDISLSDSELSILAYYNVFGISAKTDDFLFKTNIFRNRYTFNNCKSKLKKAGLLNKGIRTELNSKLKLPVEPTLGMLIKFDNT